MTKSTFYIIISFIPFCVASCSSDSINKGYESKFTSEGCLVETKPEIVSQKPTNINMYLETSGSMFGFMPKNSATQFQTDVWALVSSFDYEFSNNQKIFEIIEKNKPIINLTKESFRNGLNSGAFQSSRSTDIPEMLDSIMKKTTDKNVSVFISDLIFSPDDNSAPKLDQITSDIENRFKKNGKASTIYALYSAFIGKYANPDHSPYYVWVIGSQAQVNYVNKIIHETLKNIQEVRYGDTKQKIAYSLLPYVAKNFNASPFSCNSDGRSYGLSEFDSSDGKSDVDLYIAVNLSGLPNYAQNLDYLKKNLTISADNGKVSLQSVENVKQLATTRDNDIIKNLKATHLLKINFSTLSENSVLIQVNLKNEEPEWIISNNVDTDDKTRNKTCGLKKMIDGLNAAYHPKEVWFAEPLQLLITKNSN